MGGDVGVTAIVETTEVEVTLTTSYGAFIPTKSVFPFRGILDSMSSLDSSSAVFFVVEGKMGEGDELEEEVDVGDIIVITETGSVLGWTQWY